MKTRAASHVLNFLEALASERGASVNTLDAYRRDLTDYEAYLKAKGADALKADATHVRGFLAARGAQKLGAASLARRLSAIRQFHKFLYAEGWRRDDPTLGVEGPRRSRPLPKLLSMTEVERLIAIAREGLDIEERPLRDRLEAARLACLIELIYGSGMRVSEALSLKKSVATAKSPLIAVRGKGDKERLAPLLRTCARRDRRVSRFARSSLARRGGWPLALSRGERERPPDAPGFRTRSQARRLGGGNRVCAGEPARASPRLRKSSATERRGPARRSGSARPRRHRDDADLYACARRARQGDGARSASHERRGR